AFGDQSLHGLAGLATRRLVQGLEHLFEALELTFRFLAMLFEAISQLIGAGCLGHLRQRAKDLFLGVVDVLQRLKHQRFKSAALAWHFGVSFIFGLREALSTALPSARSRPLRNSSKWGFSLPAEQSSATRVGDLEDASMAAAERSSALCSLRSETLHLTAPAGGTG